MSFPAPPRRAGPRAPRRPPRCAWHLARWAARRERAGVPWSGEDMKDALEAVRVGEMSINQAAIHFNLPYSSLYGRFKRGKYEDGLPHQDFLHQEMTIEHYPAEPQAGPGAPPPAALQQQQQQHTPPPTSQQGPPPAQGQAGPQQQLTPGPPAEHY
ncbi:hypothetical protein E2C01_081286 [Portunus trituberculatus]|uniref:HTH psq-type domain-containing protein n=1 Tax=Portunus trituberculatus TaxID=210409 RepID=A0A5B7IYE1_PORTR|nr:hypothetical protein [Portunus trituberculatus]